MDHAGSDQSRNASAEGTVMKLADLLRELEADRSDR